MKLFLLRHGEAEYRVSTDEARKLTAQGQQEIISTASQLLKDETLDLILHSPYVRAVQSAELVVKTIAYKGKIEQTPWITPDDDPRKVIAKLDNVDEQNILIVSHQPLLGLLAALLTDGNQQFALSLRTAELLVLEGDMVAIGTMQLSR